MSDSHVSSNDRLAIAAQLLSSIIIANDILRANHMVSVWEYDDEIVKRAIYLADLLIKTEKAEQ